MLSYFLAWLWDKNKIKRFYPKINFWWWRCACYNIWRMRRLQSGYSSAICTSDSLLNFWALLHLQFIEVKTFEDRRRGGRDYSPKLMQKVAAIYHYTPFFEYLSQRDNWKRNSDINWLNFRLHHLTNTSAKTVDLYVCIYVHICIRRGEKPSDFYCTYCTITHFLLMYAWAVY